MSDPRTNPDGPYDPQPAAPPAPAAPSIPEHGPIEVPFDEPVGVPATDPDRAPTSPDPGPTVPGPASPTA